MSANLIYVVTVSGRPVYSNYSEAEANIEAELQGGVVTPIYLYGGVKK